MSRIIDRLLAILLLLGAAGHMLGSFEAFGHEPVTLLWSLCAGILVVLLGALHLLRTWRPGDRALAWIACLGTVCWLGAAIAFGVIIGKLFDPRVLIFALISIGLIGFSLKAALIGTGTRT